MKPATRIDIHSHYLPEPILEFLKRDGQKYGTPVETRSDGQRFILTPERPYGPIKPGFYDLQVRAQYLEEHGIDMQVLVPPPFLYYSWLDPKIGSSAIREANTAYASTVHDSKGRYKGIGALPMLDAQLSIRECENIRKIGLSGVASGSNINDLSLADERFWPIYEAMEDMELPLFIHPSNVLGGDRMGDFHLKNLIGFPADTTLMAAQMIFTGVLDRFKKLKICLGQAGGFLPYIFGRLDQGYRARPECRRFGCAEPSSYVKRFYYDTIIHATKPLAYMVDVVGANRVMFGSDFPFDMRSELSLDRIDNECGLTEDDLQAIYYRTASEFYNIDSGQ